MSELLAVDGLQVHFPLGHGDVIRAVDGVSFSLARGEMLGLVGESGCGKSTTGRAVLRLIEPTAGSVVFDSVDVRKLPPEPLRLLRRRMQMVFQDPFASLSPRMTVGRIVGEPLDIHRIGSRDERRERVATLLDSVGVGAGVERRFPHEFSGGQRQRIGLARALALDPEMLVLDEPVSALDVSVRAQVINLLQDIQSERGIAYLFIGHDLSLIRHLAHRIAVMYLGRIVEIGPAAALYDDPRHPYTRSLLSAIPAPDPTRRRIREPLAGDPPSPIDIPSGCRFRTRCPFAQEICAREDPALIAPSGTPPGQRSACHFRDTLPPWQEAA